MEDLLNIAPQDIERLSFEIIERSVDLAALDERERKIVLRCIHTSADFDYAKNLSFLGGVVDACLAALQSGADIVTDTQMAAAGINKRALQKHGGQVHCFMQREDVAIEAKARGVTRSAVCMEKACAMDKPMLLAIGNAPTALIAAHRLIGEARFAPRAIIAAPVGFVNVLPAKALIKTCGVPCIVAEGQKGGSNIAAAICNALLYML